MPILYLNLLLISIYSFVFGFIVKRSERSKNVYLIICLLQLCLIRTYVEPDSTPDLSGTWGYVTEFENLQTMNVSEFMIYMITMRYEPLYLMLVRLCAFVSLNYRFYLFVVAFLSIAPVFCTIKKHSNNIYLSTLIFVMLFNTISIYVLRQALALGILSLTYSTIIEKKPFSFVGLVLIASLFHYSSLIWLFIYPLYQYVDRYNKFIFVIFFGILSALYIKSNASSILSQFDYYSMYTEEMSSYKMGIIQLYMLLGFVFFGRKKVLNHGIHRLCLITLAIGSIGLLIANYAERTYQCFKYLDMFVIPLSVTLCRNTSIRNSYLLVTMVLCFALFINDDYNNTIKILF